MANEEQEEKSIIGSAKVDIKTIGRFTEKTETVLEPIPGDEEGRSKIVSRRVIQTGDGRLIARATGENQLGNISVGPINVTALALEGMISPLDTMIAFAGRFRAESLESDTLRTKDESVTGRLVAKSSIGQGSAEVTAACITAQVGQAKKGQ